MTVRFTTGLAGQGVAYNVGEMAELDEKDALALIAAGYAEPVKKPTRATRTTSLPLPPQETADAD